MTTNAANHSAALSKTPRDARRFAESDLTAGR
jgi:hypothetical protein